jgi:hypothetical protein
MSVIEFLDRLRAKPESTRRRIIFFTTVVLWSAIVSVWWFAVNFEDTNKDYVTIEEFASPWKSIWGKVAGVAPDPAALLDGVTAEENSSTTDEAMSGILDPSGDADIEWSGGGTQPPKIPVRNGAEE